MILLKSDVRLLYYTFLKDVDSCFSINALFYWECALKILKPLNGVLAAVAA